MRLTNPIECTKCHKDKENCRWSLRMYFENVLLLLPTIDFGNIGCSQFEIDGQ